MRSSKTEFNEEAYEDMVDSITEAISETLQRLKNNEDATRTKNYEFFLTFKGRVFDFSVTLESALQLLEEYPIENDKFSNTFTTLRTTLIDKLQANKHSLKYKSESNSDAITNIRKFIDGPREKTIADKLLILADQLFKEGVNKDNILKLIIALEADKSGLNCPFISILDLPVPEAQQSGAIGAALQNKEDKIIYTATSVALFRKISEMIEANHKRGVSRMQFILREGLHHLALDINISTRSCILLDAACDSRKIRIHQLPKYVDCVDTLYDAEDIHGVKTSPTETRCYKVQMSESGCMTFAFDHVRNAAGIQDLHEALIKSKGNTQPDQNNVIKCDWTDLPPCMVKNAQSTTYIDGCINRYKVNNTAHAEELAKLTNNNTKDYGINQVKQEIVQTVKNTCANKSPAEIDEIIRQPESHQSPGLEKK